MDDTVIRALARGLQVIEHLQVHSPASLADLHRGTGLPKVTLLRLLYTLQDDGWVYRRNGDDRYRLSCHLHRIGDHLMAVDALIEAAGPVLDALQGDLLWPASLSVRKGLRMEVVETTRKKQDLMLQRAKLGESLDMLCSASGQAYLAFCSETERAEILERLVRLATGSAVLARDQDWLDSTLAGVIQRGYGWRRANITEAEPRADELDGIAVPVWVDQRVKASLSVVWPEGALSRDQVDSLVYPRLLRAAQQLGAGVRQSFFDEACC